MGNSNSKKTMEIDEDDINGDDLSNAERMNDKEEPEKNELLVYGFMREWNEQQTDTKRVPTPLIKYIVKYFPIDVQFSIFGRDSKLYEKSMQCYGPTTGLLNTIFTDKMCDRFEIIFRVIRGGESWIGYLYEWKDRNAFIYHLGSEHNSQKGKAAFVRLKHEGIIKMVFSFKQNDIKIYQNEEDVASLDLCDNKRIIPGVCVNFGPKIEFVECKFD